MKRFLFNWHADLPGATAKGVEVIKGPDIQTAMARAKKTIADRKGCAPEKVVMDSVEFEEDFII